MNKRNAKMVSFLLLTALLAGRFVVNLRQRAARAYPDKFAGATFPEHFALIWEVMRWSGPHLAPDGVFHLTRYLSVPTPTGPVGLLPGQELRVVREAGARVIVTAPAVSGSRELDVPRSALTDDLDLAHNLAVLDWTAHEEFHTQVEADAAQRERVRLGLYREAAADLATAEHNRMTASDAGIGGRQSALQQGASFHNSQAYPVVVPSYVPTSTGAVTIPAGASSSGGTLGNSPGARAAADNHPAYTTSRPGSVQKATVPAAAAKPTPALNSGSLGK